MKAKRRESGSPRTNKPLKVVAKHRKPSLGSVRRAFYARYPLFQVDDDLLKLVGIDPPMDVRSEKRALREAAVRADRK
jgi:hypothetical protein